MDAGFPFLPIGTVLPDGSASGRLLDAGPGWQVCAAGTGGGTVVLLEGGALAGDATVDGFGCVLCAPGARPLTLAALALRAPPVNRAEALSLTRAVLRMAEAFPASGWSGALFVPPRGADDPGRVLPAAEAVSGENRRAALLAALSGGIALDPVSAAGLLQLNTRLDLHTAQTVLDLLAAVPDAPAAAAGAPDGFTLPGQPALEALLRQEVLDVLHRPAAYARLGVSWPGGVLLAGPPGCGKSFAAARLAAFLGWKLHEVSVAGVGSAWLHETPRQIHASFARAAQEAPAVVLLEELDALGQSRDGFGGPRVEEVNTLLREVETAPGRRLLVVGTTNKPDSIDRALRRRGRFDIVFTMDHPDAAGAAAVLQAQLANRPHVAGMDVAAVGRRLARRPASDLAWVVDEAARLAVRSGRTEIDDLLLARAAALLPDGG